MKDKIVKLGIAGLNIIYKFIKLLPVQDKIVYISRQLDSVPVDFQMCSECIAKKAPNYKQVILAKRIPESLIGKVGYCFHILKQMYHIATARAVILDTYCIPVSILKQRDDLLVIQMWHALGAFKKFGYSILGQKEGRSEKTAKLMHMHENYTYVLSSSEYAAPFFAEAFRVPREDVKIYPLPKTDLLVKKEENEQIKEKVYSAYPKLRDTKKKVIVYAPTFRLETENDLYQATCQLIEKLDFNEYEFVFKKHPLVQFSISDERVIEDQQFSTMDFMTVADIIITDYSAVLFEALFLKKEIYFYAFDYDYYTLEREFYLDYEKEMPGPIAKSADEMIEYLKKQEFDFEKAEAFKNKMIAPSQKTYTEDFVEFLLEEIKSKRYKRKR